MCSIMKILCYASVCTKPLVIRISEKVPPGYIILFEVQTGHIQGVELFFMQISTLVYA